MNYEEIDVESMGVAQKHIIIDLGNGAFKSFPADFDNPEYKAFLAMQEGTILNGN